MIETINLAPDGSDEIRWSRAVAQLDELRPAGGSRGPTCWLSTVRPDGRTHLAGVVGHWLEDTLYFVSGPKTQKARNLAADRRCSFAMSLANLDLVLDGAAVRVTHADELARVARRFDERGWPLQVEGERVTASFWAPTAPPPPWNLYAFTPTTVLGVATVAPSGATRWKFSERGEGVDVAQSNSKTRWD
jgi:hypothetical protein